MDYLESLRTFCAVFETRNFRRAAEALGVSTATVTRAIQVVEQRLNARLFHRNTRSLANTEAGVLLYEGLMKSLEQLDKTERSISNRSSASGLLRLVAHSTMSANDLVELVTSFQDAYPAVSVELTLADRPVDLIAEGFDVGLLYPFSFTSNGIITSVVATERLLVVVSPIYLKQSGCRLLKPEDLLAVPFIAFSPVAGQTRLFSIAFQHDQKTTELEFSFAFSSNSAQVNLEMLLKGFGFGIFPHSSVEPYLKSGRLLSVLDESKFQVPDVDLHLAYSSRKYVPSKVREFKLHAKRFFSEQVNP